MIWRRGRSPDPGPAAPSADGPRDAALTMLSVDQARALVTMYRLALAERGLETTPRPDGVLAAPGLVFGPHNLAVELAQQPWTRWRSLIEDHAAEVSAAGPGTDFAVTAHQLRPWLWPLVDGPPPSRPLLQPLPGIAALVAVEQGDGLRFGPDLTALAPLAALGDPDELLDRAVANLRRLPLPQRHDVPAVPGQADSVVHGLLSNDAYGAARLLLVDELSAHLLGTETPTHGRLVAVPNQHGLLVHEPSGPGVRDAIGLMARVAQARFRDGTTPISPHVYYLPRGRPAEQITRYDDEGTASVHLTRALQMTFDRLGAADS